MVRHSIGSQSMGSCWSLKFDVEPGDQTPTIQGCLPLTGWFDRGGLPLTVLGASPGTRLPDWPMMACPGQPSLSLPSATAAEAPPAPLRRSDPDLLPPAERRRLLLSYGLGDAGTGMAASLIGFYLFIFYTSAAGLPAWMAGLVLMVARLWDAMNDPIVGWLSDHTRTRWGPRLPWIFASALPLGAAMAAMWWLPPGGIWVKFWVFVAISVIANSLYTCVNLPYSALPAELTESTTLRTQLNTKIGRAHV